MFPANPMLDVASNIQQKAWTEQLFLIKIPSKVTLTDEIYTITFNSLN